MSIIKAAIMYNQMESTRKHLYSGLEERVRCELSKLPSTQTLADKLFEELYSRGYYLDVPKVRTLNEYGKAVKVLKERMKKGATYVPYDPKKMGIRVFKRGHRVK
ncbi:TPA: hypothetical protein HA265_01130, partial [Candidatus Woesearchaeota archaeon]|nr:hypothetical protein [Candidatus Woesearchaeota archaeon]